MVYTYFMDAAITSHILIFQNDSVLLVRHGGKAGHITGTYGIPGGHRNGNESLEEAAVREFKEETGLEVDQADLEEFLDNEYSADILRKDGTIRNFTMHIFLAKKWTGEIKENEETSPLWIDIGSLDKYNLLPNVKKAILVAMKFAL